MSALTEQDLEDARGLWEEWTTGSGFDLDVVILGQQHPARMDPDRPLGAIIEVDLGLRLRVSHGNRTVFDGECPYDGLALRTVVGHLARTIAER